MSEYRIPDHGRSDALEALAERARHGEHEIALRGHTLPAREATRRLRLAAGVDDNDDVSRLRRLVAIVGLGALASALLRDVPTADRLGIALIGLAAFGLSAWLARRARRVHQSMVATALAWPGDQPFPIEGYADWLVADKPVLQLTLRTGIDANILRQGLLIIDPTAQLEVVDARRYRLALPRSWAPSPRADKHGTTSVPSLPTATSNAVVLRALTTQVLIPLHREVGVVGIRMGERAT